MSFSNKELGIPSMTDVTKPNMEFKEPEVQATTMIEETYPETKILGPTVPSASVPSPPPSSLEFREENYQNIEPPVKPKIDSVEPKFLEPMSMPKG